MKNFAKVLEDHFPVKFRDAYRKCFHVWPSQDQPARIDVVSIQVGNQKGGYAFGAGLSERKPELASCTQLEVMLNSLDVMNNKYGLNKEKLENIELEVTDGDICMGCSISLAVATEYKDYVAEAFKLTEGALREYRDKIMEVV